MIKKILSKYFVVAVVAVAMGCVSSCKDYEDEMYSELKGDDVALKQDLEGQISKLRNDLNDSLKNARAERDALTEKLNQYIQDAENKYATKQELADTETALRNQLDQEINTVVNNITQVAGELASLTARVQTLENEYAKASDLAAAIDGVKAMFADYYTKAEADKFIDEAELKAALDTLSSNDQVKELVAQVISEQLLSVTSGSGVQTLGDLVTLAENANSKADANAAEIAKLNSLIEQLKQCNCPVLVDRVVVLEGQVDSIKNVCKELEYNYTVLNSAVEELGVRIDTLSGIEETKALAYAAQVKAEQYAKEYTDAAIEAILEYVNPRFASIDEMLAELVETMDAQADKLLEHDASIAALNESVAALRGDITSLEERVAKNEADIAGLADRVANLEEALKNRISSIIIQATKSPVVGYFNMPMGIKSNVLAAYYGEAMENVYFPTIRTANLISGVAFTEEEAALLGFTEEVLAEQGETLIDGEGNAGTLYMTINPAEVNLDGVNFSLVNSKDEVSYVTLGAPVASTEKLTFGYTRAGNGFYEVPATIEAENAGKVEILKMEDMQSLVSQLKSSVENGSINFADLASNIQTLVNDIADANAVKASWGENNVYSEYALAAVTVKPLSFQFMQGVKVNNFPGISRASNFINSVIDKINIALPEFDMEITAPEIHKIQIKDVDEVKQTVGTTLNVTYDLKVSVEDVKIGELTGTTESVTVTVPEKKHTVTIDGESCQMTIPSYTIDIPANQFTVEGGIISIPDVEQPIEIQVPIEDFIEEIYGSMTEPMEDVNTMLGELEKFMDDVNDMLDELKGINNIEQSITNAMGGIKSELNKYLEALNNKLCNAINSIHDRLQPNMLLKTTDGFTMLSQVKNQPTVLNAQNCVLVPTTYTNELLVPTFKKYVAVTNVKNANGEDVTAAEIANVNTGDLNKVLAGTTNAIEFKGKSGYTYEIAYSALDYSGKYSNVKYYVKVK